MQIELANRLETVKLSGNITNASPFSLFETFTVFWLSTCVQATRTLCIVVINAQGYITCFNIYMFDRSGYYSVFESKWFIPLGNRFNRIAVASKIMMQFFSCHMPSQRMYLRRFCTLIILPKELRLDKTKYNGISSKLKEVVRDKTCFEEAHTSVPSKLKFQWLANWNGWLCITLGFHVILR
jgi:hypothetical protein